MHREKHKHTYIHKYVHIYVCTHRRDKELRGDTTEKTTIAREYRKKCIKRQKKHKSMLFYTATAIFANIIAMRMNEEEYGKKIYKNW